MNQNKCVEHVYQPDPSENKNKNQIEFVTISLDYMSIQIFGFWYVCVCDEKKCEKRKEKKNAQNDGNKNTIHAIKSDGCLAFASISYKVSNIEFGCS